VAALQDSWYDLYGALWSLWEGLPGGDDWLLASTDPGAVASLEATDPRFKGRLWWVLCPERAELPVARALRAVRPRGLFALGADLAGGPAGRLPYRSVRWEGGVGFLEGGELAAWQGALWSEGAGEAPDPWGAAASACGVPVCCCQPGQLPGLALAWWQRSPQALLDLRDQ
jgi:hypothetical protein